jgi:hypothetical protein
VELRPTRNGLDRRTPTTVSPQHPPAQAKPNGRPVGGIYIDVPNWDHRDRAHVAARAKLGPGNISLGFNVPGSEADTANTFP